MLPSDLPGDPRRRGAVLGDMLWADLSGPTFPVFVKLSVAASENAELYLRLVPVERALARAIAGLVDELAGETLTALPDAENRVRLAYACMPRPRPQRA